MDPYYERLLNFEQRITLQYGTCQNRQIYMVDVLCLQPLMPNSFTFCCFVKFVSFLQELMHLMSVCFYFLILFYYLIFITIVYPFL